METKPEPASGRPEMIDRARGLLATIRGLIHEIAKFGVIGFIAYVLTVLLDNWLRFGSPKLGPITSLAIAILVTATLSYFANRHWTWRDKARQGVGREYTLFIALSVVGLLVTEIPLGFSEYVLGFHSALAYNIAGNLLGTGLGTVWRFWSFKRWVFVETEPAKRSPESYEAALI